jgi:hypothetical protein
MTSDPPTSSGSSQPPRPRGEAARPDPRPLHQGLERLRDLVHQRLDRIEAMARERGDDPAHEPSQRELELRNRIAELEERQARIVAEARRMEQEWHAGMEKIENDRRLLAEAWERLERERIDGVAPSAEAPGPRPPQAPAAPTFRPTVAPQSNDVVTHAVLKQFQALRSDVRKNTNGHRPHR